VVPAPRPLAPELERRRRAARAGHEGDVATARSLLGDDDPGVRAIALGALARLQALDPAELATAAADRDPTARRRALEVAARMHPADVTVWAAVLDALADPDDTVAEVAAFACGERGEAEPAARPAGLVDRLAVVTTEHGDALCREAAVAALGALGDPAGLPAVLAATGDRATVRRRAVIALAPFEGPEVEAALERARSDRDWQVRQAAEDLTS
jgi:HEAT repeat protein